jgi:hypothetical protein
MPETTSTAFFRPSLKPLVYGSPDASLALRASLTIWLIGVLVVFENRFNLMMSLGVKYAMNGL